MPKTMKSAVTIMAVAALTVSSAVTTGVPAASADEVETHVATPGLALKDASAQYTVDNYFEAVDKTWVKGRAVPTGLVLKPYASGPTATQQVLQRQEVLDELDVWKEDDATPITADTEVEPLELSETSLRIEVAASVYTEWSVDEDGTTEDSAWEEFRKLVLTRSSTSSVWKIVSDDILPDEYFYSVDAQLELQSQPTAPDSAMPEDVDVTEEEANQGDAPMDEPSSDTFPPSTIPQMPPLTPYASSYKYIKQNKLNRTKVANKALQWSKKTNKMSSNFPRFKNNCANLASQSLRAGGWQYRNGTAYTRTTVWAPRSKYRGKPATWTWGSAAYLYYFVNNTGKKRISSVWNAQKGDLLFVDWDPKGRADGKPDHVMIVTGRSGASPKISQQSPARHNITLKRSISKAKAQGKKKIVFYAKRMD